MADKRIQDLTAAASVQTTDLFVLEQSGTAKKLTGQTLITDLATALDGHGGISDITYTAPVSPSLNGTLTITMADETSYSVTIQNGNGIASIAIAYGISATGTDPTLVPSWSSSVVTPTDASPYQWTRISITDKTGTVSTAYSVTAKAANPTFTIGNVTAQTGSDAGATVTNSGTAYNPTLNFGFTLPKGDKGDTGDYIEPVVSYGTSTAAANTPSTWYSDPSSISYVAGNFIWRKTEYTLHEGQTVQSTKTEIIGYIGQNGSGSGTVTQITVNGSVFADDGTGNVPMTIDADIVGAVADPSTKSNGQVLTWDSTAGEWVAATPSTGNVNTVNSVGVDVGTTNITLYANHIKMSSSDNTTIPNAIPQASSATPQPLGTAAAGSGTTWARADHVHAMPSASDVGALPVGTTPADIGAAIAAAAVPTGGNKNQALVKTADSDYSAGWHDVAMRYGNDTRFSGAIQDISISPYQTAGGYAFLLVVVNWVTFGDLAGLYLIHGIASGQYQGITTILRGSHGPANVNFNGTDKIRINYYNEAGGYYSIIPLVVGGF